MIIVVTKHAIVRYRQRMFDYSSTNKEIINKLSEIVLKGRVVCYKPNKYDNCTEINYNGVSIVVVQNKKSKVVITCLGNSTYRKWVKAKGMSTFLSQSLLYSNANNYSLPNQLNMKYSHSR